MPTPLLIVQQLYYYFSNRDYENIRKLMAPDISWSQMEGFPNGGVYIGPDQVFEQVFNGFRENWYVFKTVTTELLEAGEAVIVLGYYEGIYRRTGNSVKAAFAHHYQVREGKITRFQQYTDTFLIAQAMGKAGNTIKNTNLSS